MIVVEEIINMKFFNFFYKQLNKNILVWVFVYIKKYACRKIIRYYRKSIILVIKLCEVQYNFTMNCSTFEGYVIYLLLLALFLEKGPLSEETKTIINDIIKGKSMSRYSIAGYYTGVCITFIIYFICV